MITTAIINLAYFFISGIIGFFPVGQSLPSLVHSSAIWLGGYLALINDMVPIATLATVIGVVFATEIALFGFRTIKWVISHLPFIGGKG